MVAAEGPGALDIVRQTPGIHLDLLDVVMPGGVDGHELADEIEKISPGMQLLLMSGYSAKMAAGLDDPGARPFLSKPVSLSRLAKTLRKALDEAR